MESPQRLHRRQSAEELAIRRRRRGQNLDNDFLFVVGSTVLFRLMQCPERFGSLVAVHAVAQDDHRVRVNKDRLDLEIPAGDFVPEAGATQGKRTKEKEK